MNSNKISQLHYKYRGYIAPLLIALSFLIPRQSIEINISYLCILGFWLSFTLRLWARSHCGSHTRGEKLEAPKLIQSGPYLYTRHPLYISNTLFGVSWAFWTGLPLEPALILSFLFAFHSTQLAQSEDLFLKKTFGKTWVIWAKTTPTIPWKFSFKQKPSKTSVVNLFQGFKQDTWTWVWQCLLIFLTPLK